MNESLKSTSVRIREVLDKALSRVLISLMVLLVLNVTWQVASRYLLQSPSAFTDELARFLLIWLGMLGSAYALGQRIHLAIDLFISSQKLNGQRVIRRGIHLLIALFALSVMVYGGGYLVVLVLELDQTSAALGLKLGYVYLAIPLSGLLMIMYAILNFINPKVTYFESTHINT